MFSLKPACRNKVIASSLFFLLASATQSLAVVRWGPLENPPSSAQTEDHGWTVTCDALRIDNYLIPDLEFKPVFEGKVSWTSPQDGLATGYEDLWYGTTDRSLCLGERRHKQLTIPSGQFVFADFAFQTVAISFLRLLLPM